MDDITSLKKLSFVLMFILPGFVTLYVRTWFVDGSWNINNRTSVFLALTLSIIYLGLSVPVLEALNFTRTNTLIYQESVIIITFLIIPGIFGVILGKVAQRDWLGKLFRSIGVSRLHPFKTAWDYKMKERNESWVNITLKDETVIAGHCGPDAFMSGAPGHRDLYMDVVNHVDGVDRNIRTGMYIAHDQIKTIEFIPSTETPSEQDTANVRREQPAAAQ